MMHLSPESIAAYLDGGLDPGERKLAAAHLADCGTCRRLVAAQVRALDADELVRVSPRDAAPERGSKQPTAGGIGRWVLLAASIGAVLVAVGLWRAGGPAGGEVAGTAPEVDRAAGMSAERSPPGSPSVGSPVDSPPVVVPEPTPSNPLPTPEPGRANPERIDPNPPAPAIDPSLLALRGGSRRVLGKTFRLTEGTWVDSAYDRRGDLTPIDLVRDGPLYARMLAAHPELAEYASVGPQVLVVIDSLAYRISP